MVKQLPFLCTGIGHRSAARINCISVGVGKIEVSVKGLYRVVSSANSVGRFARNNTLPTIIRISLS
jgi:hypothetical protein